MRLDYLPDENDRPINEHYRLHRVFHLADIKKPITIGNEFMAIGVSDHNSPIGGGSIINRGTMSDLPAVKTEFNLIRDIMKPYQPKPRTQFVLDDEARESYFKSLDGTDITTLHIATHGFYKSHNALLKAAMQESDFDHYIADRALSVGKESLSGLVMRLGNISWKSATITDEEDDILTSDEIENLSFPNLKLTVLSACETGLGDVDSEGVWGLQRAFRIAGTQSLICSLRKVDDYWTSQFMKVLYGNAVCGKTVYDSFQEARNFLYKECKGKPEIWSSFIRERQRQRTRGDVGHIL